MVSKVNILEKEENARESHIKGNRIYQGRKLQGMEGWKDSKVPAKERRPPETSWKEEGKKDSRKGRNGSRKEERKG